MFRRPCRRQGCRWGAGGFRRGQMLQAADGGVPVPAPADRVTQEGPILAAVDCAGDRGRQREKNNLAAFAANAQHAVAVMGSERQDVQPGPGSSAVGVRRRGRRGRERLARRLTTGLAFTPSAFVALGGAWLAVTPLVVDVRDACPWWNDVGGGTVITVLAAIRIVVPRRTGALSSIAAIVGIWMVAAPFVLSFTHLPGVTWNNIIVGALIAGIAAVRRVHRRRHAARTVRALGAGFAFSRSR